MPKNYVVEATVCDTIRSVPVDKKQASTLSKLTKAKIPRAKVKVRKAYGGGVARALKGQ